MTAHVGIEFFENPCSQKRNIILALSKRRDVNSDDIQTEEQIFAELAVADHLLKILVCGADDSCIDGKRLGASKSCNGPFLKDSENLHLKRERHITYLIQKKCSAVCKLEHSYLSGICPSEGSLLVAEKLAFKKVLRNSADVYCHKGT